jgi:hypothetical protein
MANVHITSSIILRLTEGWTSLGEWYLKLLVMASCCSGGYRCKVHLRWYDHKVVVDYPVHHYYFALVLLCCKVGHFSSFSIDVTLPLGSLHQIQHKQIRKMPTSCCQICEWGFFKRRQCYIYAKGTKMANSVSFIVLLLPMKFIPQWAWV